MSAKAAADRGRRRGKSREAPDRDRPEPEVARPAGNPYLATALAWAVPGAGHLFLGRWQRALGFFVLVLLMLVLGCHLEGKLPWVWGGSPLQVLATIGCLGSGLPVLVLRFGFGYEGTLEAAGYEYGGAFILTAGLMNLLLMLDAWDIARGRKE